MPRNEYHDTPVVELHEAFGLPVAWAPGVPPEERRRLRVNLLLEEVLEFAKASGFIVRIGTHEDFVLTPAFPPNLTEAADALADIRYVTDGAAVEWGIPLEKCLREVHRSNMSKLGDDGRPILRDDGKFLKGPNYTPPQLDMILELYRNLPR